MKQRLRDFTQAEERLRQYWQQPAHHRHGLEPMRQLMDFLGNPQDRKPAVHIAGTSGKTSTAYYAASLLRAAGCRVGLIVSPHVYSLNERVQINLEPLPEAEFCEELGLFLDVVERSELQLSYPEVLYGFGYWECARQQVDVVVVEVGMGGLLDPTNVIQRTDKLCIITDIGMDHMDQLGATLEQIAFQKAGIIGWQNTVFCYEQAREVMHEIQATARQKQADLHVVRDVALEPALQRLPLYQQRNSQLALLAVQFWLSRNGREPLAAEQLVSATGVRIPGRMEMMQYDDKIIIFDGAHNPQKLATLTATVRQRFPQEPVAVLAAFGRSVDRPAPELVAALRPLATYMVCTTFSEAESWRPFYNADELRQAATITESYEVVPHAGAALRRILERPEKVIVITGSFYIFEPIRTLLETL